MVKVLNGVFVLLPLLQVVQLFQMHLVAIDRANSLQVNTTVLNNLLKGKFDLDVGSRDVLKYNKDFKGSENILDTFSAHWSAKFNNLNQKYNQIRWKGLVINMMKSFGKLMNECVPYAIVLPSAVLLH